MQNLNYKNYRAWKKWGELFKPTEQETSLYKKEFLHISLSDKDFLDVGFGSGTLLAWAKQEGARVVGVEIQPDLCRAATVMDITAFSSIDTVPDNSFDVVAVFDVLEHISINELPAILKQLARVCRQDANILMRFPNCQSPAGLANQFGDPTHLTMLSGPLVKFLLESAGFVDVSYKEAVMQASTKRINRWLKLITHPLAWAFVFLYRITWSIGSAPLSPNIIIQAKKPKDFL